MQQSTTIKVIKDILWALTISAAVVGVGRFVNGLAATTNMTDFLPWGLWKILNMVAGAAVATSGFVVAAIVYILNLEKFKSVARFSILIGFLGYGSSLFSLLFDIGLPHRGWHPFFMWNPHSFLFEVFWCVSIYWGVTALEIIPIVTERFPIPRITHMFHKYMLPFIVLGVTLSTMHHSSLGSLFMASPTRLHPLWFSLWIPVEFLISAMGSGLATIVVLMIVFDKLYKRKIDVAVMGKLAIGSAIFLTLYLILKSVDFTVNNKWNFVFGPDYTWESVVFQAEFMFQVIIPVIIFSLPFLRRRISMLALGGASAFLGLGMHRINTGIVGYFRSAESIYIPSISEIVLSFGIMAGTTLIFMFLLERFHVFEEPDVEHDEFHTAKVQYWSKEEARSVFLGARFRRVLIIAIVVLPLTAVSLRNQATGSYKPDSRLVERAPVAMDTMRTWLRIDANRNGDMVYFPHEYHMMELGRRDGLAKEDTCVKCHHLNAPKDHNSSCRVCHTDMELPNNIFNWDNHKTRFETDADRDAFLAMDRTIPKIEFEACNKCHESNMLGLQNYKEKGFSSQAHGFKDALHGLCLTCHRLVDEDAANPDGPGNCRYCHKLNPVDIEMTMQKLEEKVLQMQHTELTETEEPSTAPN